MCVGVQGSLVWVEIGAVPIGHGSGLLLKLDTALSVGEDWEHIVLLSCLVSSLFPDISVVVFFCFSNVVAEPGRGAHPARLKVEPRQVFGGTVVDLVGAIPFRPAAS